MHEAKKTGEIKAKKQTGDNRPGQPKVTRKEMIAEDQQGIGKL